MYSGLLILLSAQAKLMGFEFKRISAYWRNINEKQYEIRLTDMITNGIQILLNKERVSFEMQQELLQIKRRLRILCWWINIVRGIN